MITRIPWLRDRMCPELIRLQDRDDQDEVWSVAFTKSGLIWLWAPLPALFTFQATSWLRRAGVSDSVAMALAIVEILLTAGFFTYLFRKRIRRLTWKQLSERGIPICVNCGYDLTGNISGVCSECGTNIEAPVRKSPRSTPQPLARAVAVFLLVTGVCIGIGVAGALLLWHRRGGVEIVSNTYAVACGCICALAGYVAARRTYLAMLDSRRRPPEEDRYKVE